MSGRSCSLARTVFFIAELLRVHEVPDRVVIDRQAARSQLGDQPAQAEVAGPASLDQPITVLTGDLPRLVAAHLAGRDAPGAPPPHGATSRRVQPRPQHARVGLLNKVVPSDAGLRPANILNQKPPRVGKP